MDTGDKSSGDEAPSVDTIPEVYWPHQIPLYEEHLQKSSEGRELLQRYYDGALTQPVDCNGIPVPLEKAGKPPPVPEDWTPPKPKESKGTETIEEHPDDKPEDVEEDIAAKNAHLREAATDEAKMPKGTQEDEGSQDREDGSSAKDKSAKGKSSGAEDDMKPAAKPSDKMPLIENYDMDHALRFMVDLAKVELRSFLWIPAENLSKIVMFPQLPKTSRGWGRLFSIISRKTLAPTLHLRANTEPESTWPTMLS